MGRIRVVFVFVMLLSMDGCTYGKAYAEDDGYVIVLATSRSRGRCSPYLATFGCLHFSFPWGTRGPMGLAGSRVNEIHELRDVSPLWHGARPWLHKRGYFSCSSRYGMPWLDTYRDIALCSTHSP